MKINIYLSYIAGFISATFIPHTTFAGQMYIYKNKSTGTTLLTNKKSNDQTLTRVKVTYYPDSNIHTYKNWGTSESAILPSYSKNKDAFNHIIQQAAQTHGVSEGLIKAVMHTESGFNTQARSPVGAQGLMQLMPATARRFNVTNAYDPQQNIMAGAEYLAWLLRRFNGNTQLALAGYNAGEGNVSKYGGIPPFKETQDYIQRVTSRLNNLYSQSLHISSTNPISTESTTTTLTSPSEEQIKYSNHKINYISNAPREIVITADGTFTDSPSHTYSTQNAIASARIIISE